MAVILEIICTVSPSSISEKTLLGLKTAGVDIFRTNMSHAELDEIYKLHVASAKKLDCQVELIQSRRKIRTKIAKDQSKEVTT